MTALTSKGKKERQKKKKKITVTTVKHGMRILSTTLSAVLVRANKIFSANQSLSDGVNNRYTKALSRYLGMMNLSVCSQLHVGFYLITKRNTEGFHNKWQTLKRSVSQLCDKNIQNVLVSLYKGSKQWHIFIFLTIHQRYTHHLLLICDFNFLFADTQHKSSTLITYIGLIYGFWTWCMSMKCTCVMETEWLLGRKEISYKFLCWGNRINLPPPMKYPDITEKIKRYYRNTM